MNQANTGTKIYNNSEMKSSLLFEIPNVDLFSIHNKKITQKFIGSLRVYQLGQNSINFSIVDYSFPILLNQPILATKFKIDSTKCRMYIFQAQENSIDQIGLLIQNYKDKRDEKFNIFLKKNAPMSKGEKLDNFFQKHVEIQNYEQVQVQNKLIQPQDEESSIENAIIGTADFATKTLFLLTQYCSKNLDQLAENIQKNTNKSQEDLNIPDFLLYLAKSSRDESFKLSNISKEKIEWLTESALILGENVGEFIKPFLGNSIGQNLNFHQNSNSKQVINIAKTTLTSFLEVQEAFIDTGQLLQNRALDHTTGIIEHKLGQNAGQFSRDCVNTWKNIVIMRRVIKTIRKAIYKRSLINAGKGIYKELEKNKNL